MCKKALLITGASSDIGCELIKCIYEEYDIIVAHYYSSNKVLKELKNKLGDKLKLIQADFSQKEDVQQMIYEIKTNDIVINHIVHLAAPKLKYAKFAKSETEHLELEMQKSLYAIVDLLKAFLPDMIKFQYGRLVIMLSSVTVNVPPKYLSSYVTTKYALLGLVRSLAVEYGDKGITINGISPEMIETKFLSEIPDFVVEKGALESPLGRNLSVNDVVPMIQYLLSDFAVAINGQNLAITGGR